MVLMTGEEEDLTCYILNLVEERKVGNGEAKEKAALAKVQVTKNHHKACSVGQGGRTMYKKSWRKNWLKWMDCLDTWEEGKRWKRAH